MFFFPRLPPFLFQSEASWVPASCFAIVGVGTIAAPIFERLNAPRVIVLCAGVVTAIGIAGASMAQSLAALIILVFHYIISLWSKTAKNTD